jgi:hypothetical protein
MSNRSQATDGKRAKALSISPALAWFPFPAFAFVEIIGVVSGVYHPVRDDALAPVRFHEWLAVRITEIAVGIVVTTIVLVRHSRGQTNGRIIHREIVMGWILQFALLVLIPALMRLG